MSEAAADSAQGQRPAVHLRDVEFCYPRGGYRLTPPDLAIAASERVSIIGASGSGKTTLLQLISGILAPLRGSIEIAGTNLTALNDRARRRFRLQQIGLIFQEFELVPHLTVDENILLPYLIGGGARIDSDVERRLEQLTSGARIDALRARHPDSLSHGERQRVAICRSLITNPPLLLADEPTGNLDPETTEEVLGILFRQVEEFRTTLVFVTHEHALIDRFDTVIDFATFVAKEAG